MAEGEVQEKGGSGEEGDVIEAVVGEGGKEEGIQPSMQQITAQILMKANL